MGSTRTKSGSFAPWIAGSAIAVCTLLIGTAWWVVQGPVRTIQDIRSALVTGDSPALQQLVDFPTLRRNLVGLMVPNARASAPTGAMEALGQSIARVMVGAAGEAVAEAVVTPQTLGALTLPVWPDQPVGAVDEGVSYAAEWRNSESVVVTASRGAEGAAARSSLQFVMHRSGLSWRLIALIPRT